MDRIEPYRAGLSYSALAGEISKVISIIEVLAYRPRA